MKCLEYAELETESGLEITRGCSRGQWEVVI